MPDYYNFKVSLTSIRPTIWRRFLLPVRASFGDLHAAIQASFGWWDCHLHEFTAPGRERRVIAGPYDPDPDFGPPVPDELKVKLSSYFGGEAPKARCLYTYDFGDDWHHEVKLMRVESCEERFARRLLGGARSCPPEDCGGPGGYQRMAELAETGVDPWEDDPTETLEWLGAWQPDDFDLAAARAAFDC